MTGTTAGPSDGTVAVVGYASLDSAVSSPAFGGLDATTHLRGPAVRERPGAGGVAHLLRALSRAGVASRAVSWVARDRLGTIWLDDLRAHGVDVSGVAVTGGRSPSATLVEFDDGPVVCLFDRGDCHGPLDDTQLAELASSSWCVLTVAPRDVVSVLLERLPADVRLAWVVKHDRDAFSTDLVERLLARADLVSYSARERDFAGAGGEPALRTRPGTLLLETAGAKGAGYTVVGTDGARTGFVEAEPVEAADTTGAGDTFISSVLARLRSRAPFDELADDEVRRVLREAAHDVATLLRSRAETGTRPSSPNVDSDEES